MQVLLDADVFIPQSMRMSSTPAPPAAALVADAIARIRARRDVLDLLARKGMEMVERLVAGEAVEIAGRKPFDDPARAFAVISRAVRFCVALACRLDEAIIALSRGGPIPDLAILAPDAPAASKAAKSPASVSEPAPEAPAAEPGPRLRIARAVDAAIEAEAGDSEAAERLREYVQEHFIEGENYDALLHQPWRAVVQAICSDLGLHPDWTTLDGEDGDPPPAHSKSAHPGERRDPDQRSGSTEMSPPFNPKRPSGTGSP
jgi:hypothetical protein